MKRFVLLIMALWQQRLKIYLFSALIGAFAGIFVLYPIYDFIFVYEIEGDIQIQISQAFNYAFSQLIISLTGGTPRKTLLIGQLGALLGLFVAWTYERLHQRLQYIHRFNSELLIDLQELILQGESSLLEFKSSFRWDFNQNRINRTLETVILKTLAGFLNSSAGGTLLIGVADNGEIIGLENDFQSLKRQDQDGFEQTIMNAISTNFGADLCQYVKVLFHVINGKHVCRLIVLPSPHPVYLNQGNITKFYLRTGGGTRDMNIKEAVEFIAHRWPRLH